MRLTVFGGTGGTGRQLIHAALAEGHIVTAPAREPARIRAVHERLCTTRADVLDPASLDGTVDGADAVVSAVGAPQGRTPTTVYSGGVSNILNAMGRAGVSRLITVSALPVKPRAEVGRLERHVIYPILYRFFGGSYADMARMEELMRGTNVDWTVVRPPRLTNGGATGGYRTAIDHPLRRGRTISRADLAAAILGLLDEPRAVRATVEVAY